jgi:hypothetical protein
MIAFGAAPGLVQAAGQPKLDSQESAAATNENAPDQAEKSKMEIKQERDTQKYQDKENHAGNQPASSGSAGVDRFHGAKNGDTTMKSTAPGYENKSAVAGAVGHSPRNAATGESGKKPQ